jgi:hypothetical protein
MNRYRIAVIGGGLHGVFITLGLLAGGNYQPEDICIIDPHPTLLTRWFQSSRATGMHFLRSSSSHSVAPNFHSLRSFARDAWPTRAIITEEEYARIEGQEAERQAAFLMPYNRPSLSLFNAHAKALVDRNNLEQLHLVGQVQACRRSKSLGGNLDSPPWSIELSNGTEGCTAEIVVLATGISSTPAYPSWADQVTSQAHHLLFPPENGLPPAKDRQVTVIGGGLSAGQAAIDAAEAGARGVQLISHHPLRVSRFDFDPCYVGPKCGGAFQQSLDPEGRVSEARKKRYPGTVTAEVSKRLAVLEQAGKLECLVDEIIGAKGNLLIGKKNSYQSELLLYATGFKTGFGSSIIPKITQELGAPTSEGGYPMVSETLEWLPGMFVTGAAALGRLGPGAPNLIGAHLAARRILPALGSRFSWRTEGKGPFYEKH